MGNHFDEKPQEKITEDEYKKLLENELERAGTGGIFVWSIFLLSFMPNILNGFHVSSYTFLGNLPDAQWCDIFELRGTSWTLSEQLSITQKGLTTKGCTIHDWDYKHLSSMSFQAALNYTEQMAQIQAPKEIACKMRGNFNYSAPDTTFVSEWDLVCDRSLQRTSAQLLLTLGKFCGSFSLGMISDAYGRKSAFILGSTFFIFSSLVCSFSPWYSLYLAGLFGIGLASSGLAYPTLAMIVENICLKHRSYMSIVWSASYSLGLIILAALAYMIKPWRLLQLSLTIPSFLLILNCYLMNESPKWLITKKHYGHAYKILFKQKSHYEIENKTDTIVKSNEDLRSRFLSLWQKFKAGPMNHFVLLFTTWKLRRMIFTSYFMFCVISLDYYVSALNAPNLAVNRYLYIALTGAIEMPSYLVLIFMLRCMGRRPTSLILFTATGASLLLVQAIPASASIWILLFVMIGRLGISATYSIIPLYTAELYVTEVRSTVLGTCSTWSQIGSLSAPYVVDVLGHQAWYLPTTLCGATTILAGLLTLCLPETSKRDVSENKFEEFKKDIELEDIEKKSGK